MGTEITVRRSKKDMVLRIPKKSNLNKANLSHEKECEFCGTPFLTNRTTARFCSDNCRIANWRKEMKLYYA